MWAIIDAEFDPDIEFAESNGCNSVTLTLSPDRGRVRPVYCVWKREFRGLADVLSFCADYRFWVCGCFTLHSSGYAMVARVGELVPNSPAGLLAEHPFGIRLNCKGRQECTVVGKPIGEEAAERSVPCRPSKQQEVHLNRYESWVQGRYKNWEVILDEEELLRELSIKPGPIGRRDRRYLAGLLRKRLRAGA